MVTREDVESFLLRMELEYEEVDEGMWVVRAASEGARLVVNHTPPVLVFRVKVLDVPDDDSQHTSLYRRLLELLGDDTLRQIALWKMESYTNHEIAEKLDVAISTVERKLRLIRETWLKQQGTVSS
jgi:DNA-directed RNA polymerase specialized sigma24 family protein